MYGAHDMRYQRSIGRFDECEGQLLTQDIANGTGRSTRYLVSGRWKPLAGSTEYLGVPAFRATDESDFFFS